MTYFPTADGSVVAVNYKSCKMIWTVNVTRIVLDYGPLTPDQRMIVVPLSRTSPQISGNVLHFGTQAHALVIAIDRRNGKTLGVVQLNPHPMAVITMSPTIFPIKTGDGQNPKQMLFVGVSSLEEVAASAIPGYQCCSFVCHP